MKNIAVIANCYTPNSHADAIVTKFFTGFPSDEGLIPPKVKVVSMYIEQRARGDLGRRIARHFGVHIFPTIAEALTLGGRELAVEGVLHIGMHGNYPSSRLGAVMFPHLNHLERVFRVFDAAGRVVPVYCDKELAYSWLDSKWIYDRARELGVPFMTGSCAPLLWRNPRWEHPIGAKVTDAVSIGNGSLTHYEFHAIEILQSMLERRSGGETGVASVQCLAGQAVYEAIEQEKLSMELVEAACQMCPSKKPGTLQEHEKEPLAVLISYGDGTRGATLLANRYVGSSRAYAAKVDGKTEGCAFVGTEQLPFAHFSYLGRNLERLFITGQPQYPAERTLVTSGILDAAVRSSHAGGKLMATPHLEIRYQAEGFDPIRPAGPEPTGASLGPWPPEGLEFLTPKPKHKHERKHR